MLFDEFSAVKLVRYMELSIFSHGNILYDEHCLYCDKDLIKGIWLKKDASFEDLL